MLFKQSEFGERSNTSPEKLAAIMNAISVFAKEQTAFNDCQVLEINDFSINDNDRVDIELLFQNIDYETKTIHNSLWQKVFFVNGEILDCNTYRNRYYKPMRGRA